MSTLVDRSAALAYLTGWMLVRRMPEAAARRIFDGVADAMWSRRGRGVAQLERNLARVVGAEAGADGLRAMSRDAMRSYLRYWSEAFRLPEWSPAEVRDRIRVDNEDALRIELARGAGVVMSLPHCANWDHAGAWLAGAGMPFTTVAERLRPESLYDRFVAYRQRLGMEVLPASGGHDVFGTLSARLRAGGLVCLVADRDLTVRGVPVSFFGETARMPAGPAALALRTGAALLPVTLWYGPRHLHLRIHPPVRPPGREDARRAGSGSRGGSLVAMTQQVASTFEDSIRAHPADWHMLARLWTADLNPTRDTVPAAGR